jgi:hypothetical protein
MSYQIYKIFHILGLSCFLLGSGWILLQSQQKQTIQKSYKKWGALLHGLGLLILFISGFGLAARLGFVKTIEPWMQLKILVWVFLGLSTLLIKKYPQFWLGFLGLILFGITVSTYSALYKPF